MVTDKKVSGGLEWRVRMSDGSTSEILVPETGLIRKICSVIIGMILGLVRKVQRFLNKAWDVAVGDPRKIVHCVKVGMALAVVSLFYYVRPLYQGVGGTAMWAVLTVVVVFEFTVGACLSKSFNRTSGTCLAGFLAVGVHWIASQSGEEIEPIILRSSVFILAAAATFSRFIPTVKARFDYGVLIFILTFSLVSVSSYRVKDLLDLAQERLSTVVIGEAICLVISMLICPVWAGQELHVLVARNMEKLATSLDASVTEHFKENTDALEDDEETRKKIQGYKCVLNSKASEESMANFARWEPAHGRFSYRHPWKQYLKMGVSVRNCAYCIEALIGCLNSDIQAPEIVTKHLSKVCMKLSSHSSLVLQDLARIIKNMRTSSTVEFSVEGMKSSVQELQVALKSLPEQYTPSEFPAQQMSSPGIIPLIEVLPVVSAISLLIEIATRIEQIVFLVDELAKLANFKPVKDSKSRQGQMTNKTSSIEGKETMKLEEIV
ncbi:hypothetical protein ACHQM5_000096 [Ranunculus cassubicifolius]